MTFWSSQKLARRIAVDGIIDPESYSEARIDCASYTLTVGSEAYITDSGDGSASKGVQGLFGKKNWIKIPPGQFGFLITAEQVTIPADAIGFISLKTKYKFKGLVNVSGFHVDPGYSGRLIFGVFNAGPSNIHLKRGEELFLLFLSDLEEASDKRKRTNGFLAITSDVRNNISGNVLSLSDLRKQIEALERKVERYTIFATILGTAAAAYVIRAFFS